MMHYVLVFVVGWERTGRWSCQELNELLDIAIIIIIIAPQIKLLVHSMIYADFLWCDYYYDDDDTTKRVVKLKLVVNFANCDTETEIADKPGLYNTGISPIP